MKRVCTILSLIFFPVLSINGQKKNILFDLSSSAGLTTRGHVPFWFRSNQFGSVPIDHESVSLFAGLQKEYKNDKTKFFDWGVAACARSNFGTKSNFKLIEGFVKLRFSIVDIKAGRSKEIMGLCDSTLTSGAWAVSGTAQGIPKVQISIPEFYILPVFDKLFAIKGNYAHGWIGKTPVNFFGDSLEMITYFHQKSFYGRFGKPNWRMKLYGGFNHQTFWGKDYGDFFNYSAIKTYIYVITSNKRIGNSLGSIDVGLEYEFENVKLFAYRQNIYDGGALYYLANIRDGLNGLSIINKKNAISDFKWKKVLIEVLYTKSQGGEQWSVYRKIRSATEDYYNNWQYIQGWSYNKMGLGNPFITTRAYTRIGLVSDPNNYFINNRVVVFHMGFEGGINSWSFLFKSSYSLNYGTYNTSNVRNTGYGLFGLKKQISTFLETKKELRNGLNIGLTGAFDVGDLYYNSVGVMFNVSKTF